MTRRRNTTNTYPAKWIQAVAQQLAKQHGASPEDFRHIEIRFHNGQQWTIECRWEQHKHGRWIAVPWTSLD